MGIFSGVKDLVLPAIGGTAGFFATGGSPTGAAVGAGIGFSLAGANEQADALEKAGDIAGANAMRQDALLQQFLQDTEQFRELGREQIPGLRAEAEAEPGTSPLFKKGFEEGITELQERFGALGLGTSGAFGEAAGKFASELTSSDINKIRDLKAQLANLGTTGFSQALGAAQLGQGASSSLANFITAQGAQSGGTFGDIGSTLITAPLLFGEGTNTAPQVPQATGGTLGSGSNNLTFGSQFNQFQQPNQFKQPTFRFGG